NASTGLVRGLNRPIRLIFDGVRSTARYSCNAPNVHVQVAGIDGAGCVGSAATTGDGALVPPALIVFNASFTASRVAYCTADLFRSPYSLKVVAAWVLKYSKVLV